MAHKFKPENWERLIGVERRRLLDPETVLDVIGVATGSTVADVGAGPGFFTFPLAERVGANGRVLALDVSPEMVRLLRDREPPSQVEVGLSEEGTLPVADATVDLVLLAFVFHEIETPAAFLAEIRRVLRAEGRLALLEWVPRDEDIGPPAHERVRADEATKQLEAAGFTMVKRRGLNGSQYLLLASR